MKKTVQHNSGFTSIELVFSIITVVIIIALGWLVYKDGQKNTPAQKTSSQSSVNQSVGSAACPAGDTTVANSYNKDASDNRVTCALAYGQQMSNSLQIDNGVAAVVSALYTKQLGSTVYTDGETGIVNAMIKNVSSSKQTYNLKNFSLQLPNGQLIQFNSLYGSTATTVNVASGGTAVETLVFTGISPNGSVAGQGELVYTSGTTTKATDVIIIFKKPYVPTD